MYLSKNTCQTTPEENTPVCIRIQRSRATVKDLYSRLQHASRRDDVRLVRRTTVLIDLLVHHVPVAGLCGRWGPTPPRILCWAEGLLWRGVGQRGKSGEGRGGGEGEL